jgi:stage V sporulation protein AF
VHLFGIWGLLGGSLGILLMLIFTKTLGGRRYFYPIIPFNLKDFGRLFVRPLQHTEEVKH